MKNKIRYRKILRIVGAVFAAWALALVIVEMTDHPNESIDGRAGNDFWRHAVSVSIIKAQWDSGQIARPEGYKTGMIYIHAVGAFAAAFDVLPHRALWLAGWINLFFVVTGIWMFGRIFVGNRLASGVVVVVCMAFWGDQMWIGNIPYLLLLPKVIMIPAGFAFGMSLWSLAFLHYAMITHSARKRRIAFLLLVSIVSGCLVILSHVPTTWMFFIPLAGLIWLVLSIRRWGVFAVWLLGLCLLVMCWPAWKDVSINRIIGYYHKEQSGEKKSEDKGSISTEESAENDAVESEKPENESPKDSTYHDGDNSYKVTHTKYFNVPNLLVDAPALIPGTLIIILALVFRYRSRRMRFLLIAALFFFAIWFLCGFVFGVMMGYRYIFFYGFMMQLIAVKWLWELSAHRRWWLSLVIVLVLSPVMRDCLDEAWEKYFEERGKPDIASEELVRVQDITKDEKVLASESVTYYLPAFNIVNVWDGRVHMYGAPESIAGWYEHPTSETLMQAAHRTGARWLLVWCPEIHKFWIPDSDDAVLNMDEYMLFPLSSPSD